MGNKENTKQNKSETLGLVILISCLILALSSGKLIAQSQISIALEANPSADCFPVSLLQIADLTTDFERVCPECNFNDDTLRMNDFRVVVEDPFLGWSVKVFDDRGKLIKAYEWAGGLDIGLKKTIRFLRRHQTNQIAMNRASENTHSSEIHEDE